MTGRRAAWQLAMFATAAGIVAAGIALLVAWMVGHWIVALPVGAALSVAIGALTAWSGDMTHRDEQEPTP